MTQPAAIEDIFLAALDKATAGERAAFIESACAGDRLMLRRVRELFDAHEQPFGPLDHSPVPDNHADGSASDLCGKTVGPYKLIEPIGEGGMGTVYLAEQTQPVRRLVALKIIKPGMDSSQVIARFEAERQALALMDHPNIAKVLDVGETSAGRPYFVMELVKGASITSFCEQRGTPAEDRLRLFLDTCHAIHHAHQKGVIHRDIKPSNVLVSVNDGVPLVKVIDFGVAKATEQKLTEKSALTTCGQLIGTPAYMSPEQAEFGGRDVDTRSDVFSLGVLLYELLTGTTPIQAERLRDASYGELQRMIREEETHRPSTRLSSMAHSGATATDLRGANTKRLLNWLATDLDWVVMKSLEKDRNRRYDSPGSFAADIERFLRGEPIHARPPSLTYKAKKFIRRNRATVVTTMALTLALLVGLGTIAALQVQANQHRAAEAIDRAGRESWTTASVAGALRDANERVEEAWGVSDYPDRMQLATDSAKSAMARADEFVAGGVPTDATLADLAATRKSVDDLQRHTRLIAASTRNREQFADELTGQNTAKAVLNLCRRHRDALIEFGLDPINSPIDIVARAVADSRVRDSLMGILSEWQYWGAYLIDQRQPGADPAIDQRLHQVVRSARQLCGGAYAIWQDLLDRRDVPGLVAFAGSPNALTFRSTLLSALSRDLQSAKQYRACRDFLRAAVDRYPHDVFLHYDLFSMCESTRPPDYREALRHISAVSVQRPESAFFHLRVGSCYANLEAYDLAVAAYRKSIALCPESAIAYGWMGQAFLKNKNFEEAIAASRKALQFAPNLVSSHVLLVEALNAAGRHAEALDVMLAAINRKPEWANNPRNELRVYAARSALECAEGKGVSPPAPAERASYRRRAWELLSAEFVAIKKLPASDRAFVYWTMRDWHHQAEFASVRDPSLLEKLPQKERDAWKQFWNDVRELSERNSPSGARPPNK
jgi:serine/threonine protein kinase